VSDFRIKVDFVRGWAAMTLPERYQDVVGPTYITADEFMRLAYDYDAAIMHHPQTQPTRKERGQGAQPVPDKIGLWLDVKGKHFSQR